MKENPTKEPSGFLKTLVSNIILFFTTNRLFKSKNQTTTEDFELTIGPAENRFVCINQNLEDSIEDIGIPKSLDLLNPKGDVQLDCDLSEELKEILWSAFTTDELVSIIIFTGSTDPEYWKTVQVEAFKRFKNRPPNLIAALHLYKKFKGLEHVCGESCFIGMFREIIGRESSFERQIEKWNTVVEKISEDSLLRRTALSRISELQLLVFKPTPMPRSANIVDVE